MSREISWVDKDHYRSSSDGGRTSYLYEADKSFLGSIGLGMDKCVEKAYHHEDGTTTSYKR